MRVKILDLTLGLTIEDAGHWWVEPWDSLPVLADVEMLGGSPPACETAACQKDGVFRMSDAQGAPGPIWYYYCEHCMMLILRSSAILEVRT